ncbi:hypothetical protein B5G33_15525 [Blautia sp. An81]|nr:hypothetical protein B5G33_15525 [Blautia sp. An81]
MKKSNTFYIALFLFHGVFYFTAFYLRLFTFRGYSRNYLLTTPFTWFYGLWGLWIVLNLFILVLLILKKKHHCTFFILEIIFTSVSLGLLLLSLIWYDFASLSIVSG